MIIINCILIFSLNDIPTPRNTRDGEAISEEIYFGRKKKKKKEEIFEKLSMKFAELSQKIMIY